MNALFWPAENETSSGSGKSEARYDLFEASMSDCDFVIVEGDSASTAARIEVWRAENGSPPLAAKDRTISAIITDDPVELEGIQVFPRSDLSTMFDWLL